MTFLRRVKGACSSRPETAPRFQFARRDYRFIRAKNQLKAGYISTDNESS